MPLYKPCFDPAQEAALTMLPEHLVGFYQALLSAGQGFEGPSVRSKVVNEIVMMVMLGGSFASGFLKWGVPLKSANGSYF